MSDCKCDCHKLENVMPCQFCAHRHSLKTVSAEHAATFHAHLDGCAQCREHPHGLCKEGDSILRTGFPF